MQARALKDPTLLAFADIASARRARRARRRARRGRREARERVERRRRRGGARRIRGPGFRDGRGARSRRVCGPPRPRRLPRHRVEALRHHAELAPRRPSPFSVSAIRAQRRQATGSGEGNGTERNAANAFYPPPRGLSAEALGDVATSASVAQLAGSASALAAAVWEAHGVAEPARLCALKHRAWTRPSAFFSREKKRPATTRPRLRAWRLHPSPPPPPTPPPRSRSWGPARLARARPGGGRGRARHGVAPLPRVRG